MKVKSNSQEHIWTGITGDREVLAERTKDLPTSPGVYVFTTKQEKFCTLVKVQM